MSQKDESENDIWEYKPLEKRRKRQGAAPTAAKRRCTSRKTSKRLKSPDRTVTATESGAPNNGRDTGEHSCLEANDTVLREKAAEKSSSGDFCPVCQMPFSILVVQSQRWHVAECLDTPRDKCQECPDGFQCSSTSPYHYKKFNHTLLAHNRANSDTALAGLSDQAETAKKASLDCLTGLVNNKVDGSSLEGSQDSALSVSILSDDSASPRHNHTGTPASQHKNGLLFLRSPGPEDFKKKKGWSTSSRSQKSISASQESKTELSSTPVKTESGEKLCNAFSKSEISSTSDYEISYSPLSEFPVETDVNKSECKKALFINDDNTAFEKHDEDSVVLISDGFSSEDELLTDFIDNFDTHSVSQSSSNTQLESFTSLAPLHQLPADCTGNNEAHDNTPICKTSVQSPQSIVLEHLRENILNSESLHLKNLNESFQPGPEETHSNQVFLSQTMAPQKSQTKPSQSSGFKQMDIGVFFGLKPLKDKETEKMPPDPTLAADPGHRRKRRDKQSKSKADTTADTSQGTVTVDSSDVVSAQGETRRGGTRGWRRSRWNRGNTDKGAELPRCPFYKKIPGTKFVIDAFHYGEIEGVTAYFLTHFHSDHYGGLTKNSTFPIYCNRITGNLVKSKLKVAEQYVHILPMNAQVTVEGVRVILLDANHCPGAAMLLFSLPDGQTVLHTGDFRADPSMETYTELISCRVQTLYLDTTYCSPEYTFPKQQEVINFAANTAFELVTLNPRTLVVCGSYSVGKEKVFLALAEVLGSKVCLSRDKYNTMCCLESDQVRQRITTDWKAAQVHVLPMMQLTFKKLQDHLSRFTGRYDKLVAFKPTGWTFSQQVESVEDIQPEISGAVSIYGIPYSEHSSFLELKRFVQWLQPLKIIPTVNNGNWASRKAMETCFSEWLNEAKAKR